MRHSVLKAQGDRRMYIGGQLTASVRENHLCLCEVPGKRKFGIFMEKRQRIVFKCYEQRGKKDEMIETIKANNTEPLGSC